MAKGTIRQLILDPLKNYLGLRRQISLTQEQSLIFEQLLENRNTALERILPSNMRDEFVKRIFSDHDLRMLAENIYDQELVPKELRRAYVVNYLKRSLSTAGFGTRLFHTHGIDPEKVFAAMFTGIPLP